MLFSPTKLFLNTLQNQVQQILQQSLLHISYGKNQTIP